MMLMVAIGSVIFSLGFVVGSLFRTSMYESQPWEVMRWNDSYLGYRPVCKGSFLNRGDRVIMALRLNSSTFPEEGVEYDYTD